jgi:hypothetical protein
MKRLKQKGRQKTHKSKIRKLLKKWDSQVMHGHYIRSIDTQLTNEEVTFLRLSRRDLKAETKNEIMAAQDHALQTQYHAKKYYKYKQRVNADYVKNFTRKENTLYQHVQY